MGNVSIVTNKAFHTVQAVQSHMRDKGQCRMELEGKEEEFEEFYDMEALAAGSPLWEMEEVEGVVLTNVNDDLSVFKVTRVPGYGPELAARGDVVIPSNVLCWPVACLRWRASLSLSVSLSVSVCRWLSVSLAVCLSVCQSVSQ